MAEAKAKAAKTFDPKKAAAKKKGEMTKMANLTKGWIKENPIFAQLLGMCPALAVTSTLETAIGMGLLVIFVLTASNIVISLIKNLVPKEVKIPVFIVVIATFVTIVRMLTQAYASALYDSLGIFIPLIVVNCLILGRAEAFASKNKLIDSAIDGIGMAMGFMGALMLIGVSRELLATGSIAYGVYLPLPFEGSILNLVVDPERTWTSIFYIINISIFSGPAGGFIMIGILLAIFNAVRIKKAKKREAERQAWIEQKKKEAMERKRKKALESAGDAA